MGCCESPDGNEGPKEGRWSVLVTGAFLPLVSFALISVEYHGFSEDKWTWIGCTGAAILMFLVNCYVLVNRCCRSLCGKNVPSTVISFLNCGLDVAEFLLLYHHKWDIALIVLIIDAVLNVVSIVWTCFVLCDYKTAN